MSRKDFDSLIGTEFTIGGGFQNPTWLTLSVVEDLSPVAGLAAPEIPTDAFALHFTATGPALKAGTHELMHSKLGLISLFLTPANGEYLAVVNHLLSALPASYQVPTAPAVKKA